MSFSLLSLFKRNGRSDAGNGKDSSLYLYNTLSRKKDEFKPLKPESVRMYSCGPTVYDRAHIGNLRPYVFSDILRRTLEYNGYAVKHVINITDVGHLTSDEDAGDDKMLLALRREKLPVTLAEMKKIGTKYAKMFKKDLNDLNIKAPLAFPRASEHIEGQIAFVKTLEEKGYAYTLKDGVYFDTAMLQTYGALGGALTEENEKVSRLKGQKDKHNERDFALWKFSREETGSGKRLGWDSPWGVGFPGWHIECSAMSTHYLGKHFDIHTGGMDHIPIHHNNEIAQTEALTGKKFVNYWLHSAFITIEGKKIAKSIGNTIYLYNIADRGFPPFSYRYWLLTGHYRTPMNFTWEALLGAHSALVKLHKQFLDLGSRNGTIIKSYRERFQRLINDDLDTPKAVALLFELMGDGSVEKKDKRVTVLDMNRVLGIGFIESHRQMKKILLGETKKVEVKEASQEVQELVEKRESAREEKDWETADLIREKIAAQGYTIKDTEKGPELTKK